MFPKGYKKTFIAHNGGLHNKSLAVKQYRAEAGMTILHGDSRGYSLLISRNYIIFYTGLQEKFTKS